MEKFPLNYILEFSRLRYRFEGFGIRVPNTDFVYMPVPKNACAAIKRAIYFQRCGEEFNTIKLFKPMFGIYYFHIHHLLPTRKFPKKPKFSRKSRLICVVRDPIDRIISIYHNRILKYNDLMLKSDEIPNINEFIENLDEYAQKSRRLRHHVRPQTYYLGENPFLYSKIFRAKSVDEVHDLIEENGKWIRPRRVKFHSTPKNEKHKIYHELTKESISLVKAIYYSDYKFIREADIL